MANEYRTLGINAEALVSYPSNAKTIGIAVEVLASIPPAQAKVIGASLEVLRSIAVSSTRRRQAMVGSF